MTFCSTNSHEENLQFNRNTSSFIKTLSRIDFFFSKKKTYWISNRRKISNWEGRISILKILFFFSEYPFKHFLFLGQSPRTNGYGDRATPSDDLH